MMLLSRFLILTILLLQSSSGLAHGDELHPLQEIQVTPVETTTLPEESTSLNDILWLPPLHPVAVHFPIAFILMSGILGLLFLLKGSDSLFQSLRFSLYLAGLSAVAAIASGLYFEEYVPHKHGGNIDFVMEWHERSGIALTVLIVCTALLAHFARKNPSPVQRRLVALLVITANLLLVLTSHLGGLLVHRYGVGL